MKHYKSWSREWPSRHSITPGPKVFVITGKGEISHPPTQTLLIFTFASGWVYRQEIIRSYRHKALV